jgi:CheY-specific phosphatase CheX
MHATGLSKTIVDSAAEVLETMCFACVLGLAEPEELPGNDNVSSTVRFAGDLAGSMSVTVPQPYARNLASSFLGITEAEVSPLVTRQFVSELTNMICGCVLTGLDSQGAFQLFTPTMGQVAGVRVVPNPVSGPWTVKPEPAGAAPAEEISPAADAGEAPGARCSHVLDTGDGFIAVGLQLETGDERRE